MVDIGGKAETHRVAVAEGCIRMNPAALAAIRNGTVPKGDVLAAARIAGIMAAKKTADLIPLCHPLALTSVTVDFAIEDQVVRVTASTALTGRTGVEMEAMTAASVALLTIYDMAKAVDKGMVIEGLRLIGDAAQRAPVFSFLIKGAHAHDLATLLDFEGIAVRSGQHCAHPLLQFFGVPATARASLAFYNTMEEIDVFVEAVAKVRKVLT